MKLTLIQIETRIPQSEASVLKNLTARYNEHKKAWKHNKAEINDLPRLPKRFGLQSYKNLQYTIQRRIQLLTQIHRERDEMDKIAAEIKNIVLTAQKNAPKAEAPKTNASDQIASLLTDTAKAFGIKLDKAKTEAIMQLVSLLK